MKAPTPAALDAAREAVRAVYAGTDVFILRVAADLLARNPSLTAAWALEVAETTFAD